MVETVVSSLKDRTLKKVVIAAGLAVLGLTLWNLSLQIRVARKQLSED